MKSRRPLKITPRPKDEAARNYVRGIPAGKMPESWDDGDEIGSESHKTQGNRYFTGKSKAGRNAPFSPGEIGPKHSEITGNDLGEVIDQSGKRAPYGKPGMGWANKSGKLGDLDPQETDQPSWVGGWSNLNTGPYGAGVTIDENYGVQRPRTQSRQEERFRSCNPEFQDVADDGDWTSSKWTPDV